MSTSANNNIGSITERKQHHIDVCRSESQIPIEGTLSAGFEQVRFIHNALPELSVDTISTEWSFLGKNLPFPLFISCMTGGSPEGKKANEELAKGAQKYRLPLGLGSIRVLLDHPERLPDFQMRTHANEIPILANIGAVQVRDVPHTKLQELLKATEVDALVVHLNCGQELFQKNGDRDFTGLIDAIENLVDTLKGFPVIVKETGFGIRPSLAAQLLQMGVSYVDIAGAGGTNWVMVENGCRKDPNPAGREFADWGIPTAPLIAALRHHQGKILASGGIRTGMDLAKSVALGACAGGMALPLIRAALNGGIDSISETMDNLQHVFRSVMILTGSATLEGLRQQQLICQPSFEQMVDQLK